MIFNLIQRKKGKKINKNLISLINYIFVGTPYYVSPIVSKATDKLIQLFYFSAIFVASMVSLAFPVVFYDDILCLLNFLISSLEATISIGIGELLCHRSVLCLRPRCGVVDVLLEQIN